ncbi:hypothetical protein F5I97DRAFT_631324 [Phlebopus sp. FC_14]|nr:hypothetical protein F5I97DRAFT_631324 [Phlebopus sp. FC_14]
MSTVSPQSSARGFDSLPLELLHIVLEHLDLSREVEETLDDNPLVPPLESKHSPHLRLRTICPALRAAVDTYRQLWSCLCIKWTDPSAHEVAELWFGNGNRVHLCVLPGEGKDLEVDELQVMPHVKALVDCLRTHATFLDSAAFRIPDGVQVFRDVFKDFLRLQIPHLQYVTVPMGVGSTVRQFFQDEGRTVMLDVTDIPQDYIILRKRTRVRRKIRRLVTGALHPLRLGGESGTGHNLNEHPCRRMLFPIQWERLTILCLTLNCDSLSSFHNLLATEGARVQQLVSLEIWIEPYGPLNPKWSIKQDLLIKLPYLASLACDVNSAVDGSPYIPAEDNQKRIMDFIGTFRCPALQFFFTLGSCVDANLSGRKKLNLSKLLCIANRDTTTSPLLLRTLDVRASFDPADLFNVLQRAQNLKYLTIQSFYKGKFKPILDALTYNARDPRRCSCPKLKEVTFISCCEQDFQDLSPLILRLARARLGDGYSESVNMTYNREEFVKYVEDEYTYVSRQTFVGSHAGQELVVRNLEAQCFNNAVHNRAAY